MTTETVCEEAQRLVYGDREGTYDHPAINFERIALLWSAHLQGRFPDTPMLSPLDVAWMMMQVKQARAMAMYSRDNQVDSIGYIACAQRIHEYESPPGKL